MIMSRLPILGYNSQDTEMHAARAAGWRRTDLYWERLQEKGNACHISGDGKAAAGYWRRASWIARLFFPTDDPRQVTTLANLALADKLTGNEGRAKNRYAKARSLWQNIDGFISGLTISRRARSSLFHLRMEALHWDTYDANMRTRLRAFASETTQALEALEKNRTPECRLFERWRGEKPSVFDDTRKVLAAALLIGGGARSPRN